MLQGLLQDGARILAKTTSCKNCSFVPCKNMLFVLKSLQDSCKTCFPRNLHRTTSCKKLFFCSLQEYVVRFEIFARFLQDILSKELA